MKPDAHIAFGNFSAGRHAHAVSHTLGMIALLLTCLLLPLAASARNMNMHDAPELGSDAAFASNGRLWLVTAHDGHVWLQYSDNFGTALSAPVAVNPAAENIAARGENAPEIAIGTRGQIYVSWTHPLPKQQASAVRFSRSTDGGKTFSAPRTVDDGPRDTTHSVNSMAVAGNGDVVIAWIDGRDKAIAVSAGESHMGLSLYYTWSSNGGRTFAPNRRLMNHTCECCRIALARTPDGNIAAFFGGIFANHIIDLAFGVLHTNDQPDSWQRATYSHWHAAACPEQGPGLAVGVNGVRHAVWYEASDGPALWYGQLDPGRKPSHMLKIGGTGARHADVAVHGQTVWVAWNQVGAKGYQLMLRVSHDDGVHFGPPRTVATAKRGADSPQLLVYDGKAYVAWNTINGFRLIPTDGR